MRPAQALEIQTALARQLGDERMLNYVNNLAKQDLGIESETIGDGIRALVKQAPTFHVAAAFNPLIEETSASYPDDVIDEYAPPPSRIGVIVFDDPLSFVEQRGREQLCHMITWMEVALTVQREGNTYSAWIFTLWNDANRAADTLTQGIIDSVVRQGRGREVVEAYGGFFPVQHLIMKQGQRLGPDMSEVERHVRERYLSEGYHDAPMLVKNVGRRLLAVWDLMAQPRAAVEHAEHLNRTAPGKRARRAGVEPNVQVITLRRPPTPTPHPGTGREWSHAADVREHRRRYWVGSGEDRHQVWRTIEAYTARPDLPRKPVPPKVYSLRK